MSNELDKTKEDKAKRNLFELRTLKKEELERRRMDDLFLTMKDFKNEIDKKESNGNPLEYKLNQNSTVSAESHRFLQFNL